jgi:nucleoside-triphosphatase THEP1
LEFGIQAIKHSRVEETKVIIIDEVGRLELGDDGWTPEIESLIMLSWV